MSEANGKVCCNCRNNIRIKESDGHIKCTCKYFNGYMGYDQVMSGWCRHWAREKEQKNETCENCILDGTDACPRGAGRAVDSEICDNFMEVNK